MPRHPKPAPPPAWQGCSRPIVTKAEMAAELGVTPGRLSQVLGRGMPERPDGLLDLREAALWVRDTLDHGKARETVEAAGMLVRFSYNAAELRQHLRAVLMIHAAAVAAEAGRDDLPDDAAADLADKALAAAVPIVNGLLTEYGAPLLPPPPVGCWRPASGIDPHAAPDLLPDVMPKRPSPWGASEKESAESPQDRQG